MGRVTVLDTGVGVREPLLVPPFQGGMIGWIVVFGAIIIELAGGALTYSKFVGAALPVLITPGPLDQSTGSAPDLCNALPTDHTAACLPRRPRRSTPHLSWYLALVLFGISVLLARRSRIAVWAALPAALAGVQLASLFLEQLLLHYQPLV